MRNDIITVTCRDENGIDEDRTYCIDVYPHEARDSNIRIPNFSYGSKISYGCDFLKIGKCKIPIISHNVFGGSWCAEDFHITRSDFVKLCKHLKKTGKWSIEESTVQFEYWWENKI